MGIQGLTKLLSDETPGAIKEQELKNLTGRKIAIDASMVMYQFLVAVRSDNGYSSAQLMNEAGEITSHIQGMFNRTIKLISAGIKPVYVFDGKPPGLKMITIYLPFDEKLDLKGGELAKRMARRKQAEADLAAAKESGAQEDVDKYSRRLVKVTKQHNDDCKELLRLMGVPVITAPCEAEAQCAELARQGKVYATATEDMDALTFRTPKLLRKLTMSGTGANKQPILEIDLNMALCGLDISFEQFVDLCILCGCDYCSSIKGIGPKTALKLIRQYKTLEGVVQFVKRDTKKKYQLPKDWTSYRLKPESPEPPPLSADEPANEDGEGTPPASAPVLIEESPVNTMESVGGSEPPAPPVPAPVPACDGAPKDSQDATNEESDDDGLCVSDMDDEAVAEDEEEDIDLVDLLNDEDNEADEDTQTRGTEQKGDEEGELVEPMFKRARELFFNHEVLSATEVELKWLPPQEEELRRFLVERMGFNAERVETGIKKLVEAQGKKAQQRLDSFFKPLNPSSNPDAMAGMKRKALTPAANSKNSKATKGGRGGPRR